MLVFAAITPHPPMSIAGIGNAEDFAALEKTQAAFEQLRFGLESVHPETLIVISPHADLEAYAFLVNSSPVLKGDFNKFGLNDVQEFENDINFSSKIVITAQNNEIPCHAHESFLDHGALVPLHHLTKNIKPKIVHLAFSLMDYERHYFYGQIIRGIIEKSGAQRVAVVASGDLSHRLSKNSPSGFSLEAEKFDHTILHYLGSGDLASILGLHEEIAREAAECGIRSILILLGILHESTYDFKLLSYENPFGIG